MQVSRPRGSIASVDRFFQFSLLGLVASGFLALASSHYPDRATVLLTLAALLARALAIAGVVKIEIPQHTISLAALGYVLFFPLDYYYLSGDFLASTVHGVCFLAGIKILTARTTRDYAYTGAVAFIELIGAALLSFEAGFFVWLALYILFAIAAFTSSEIRRGIERSRQTAYLAGERLGWRLAVVASIATAGILSVTLLLFLVVPRTARAATLLFPNSTHLSGFSNMVDLGNFGEIGKDTRPVMHVLSYSGAQPPSRALPPNLKWRGAALSRFDGVRWTESPLPTVNVSEHYGAAEVAGRLQRSRRDGRRMLYRVDVSASDTGTLFIAGIPEYINLAAPHLVRTSEDSFRILPANGEDLHYEVSAFAGEPTPVELSATERARYLELPPIDARIEPLARQWAGTGPPALRAVSIQRHLRREFIYSLEASKTVVRDPLSHFLFTSKTGYCEHFASAMAVMLRTVGVPSRVATGFLSGYFNDVSGMYVIRASDAHAWVEAWIEGRGWITFDPTPPSAPHNAAFGDRINMYFDAADSLWKQWVVAYDLTHQAMLAGKLVNRFRGWNHRPAAVLPDPRRAAGWAVSAIFIAALLAFGAPRLWRSMRGKAALRRIARGDGAASDAALVYRRMLAALERRGFSKPACATAGEFVGQLPAGERDAVARFTLVYQSLRFGHRPADHAELLRLLREVEARAR